ncbi:MAG: hypothetical protein GY765_29295 [bacterium]|nr:hypothetical protein [bacterium]
MRVTSNVEEFSALKYQRQADEVKKDAENPRSLPGQSDEVIINSANMGKNFFTDTIKVEDKNALDTSGGLKERIKEQSIAASLSHKNVDPRMVLSLFRDE